MNGPPSASVRLKHEHIRGVLAREIRSGRLRSGSRLPGEIALAEQFGVSRSTVRAALAELSESGLIATRTGKGSFVRYDGQPLDASLGWAHALASHGVTSTVRVLSIVAGRDEALATRWNLPSADVIVIERIREIEQAQPISYEYSTVPAIGPLCELPSCGLADGSLTRELQRAGLLAHHGEQRARAHRLDAREAELLRRDTSDWFLETTRTVLTATDGLVEQVRSLLDPEHFELALTFGGDE